MNAATADSFGAKFREGSLQSALDLERGAGRSARFQPLDSLLESVIERMLGAQEVAKFVLDRNRPGFTLLGIDHSELQLIRNNYSAPSLESRGCFFLPDEVAVSSIIQFPFVYRRWPRFAARITTEVAVTVQAEGSADAVFAWGVLLPIAELLYTPLRVSGRFDRERTLNGLIEEWPQTAVLLADLGFDVAGMGIAQKTGRWNNQQMWRRAQILSRLQYKPGLGSLIRIALVRLLVARYYSKVDKKGYVTRKRILTKEYEQLLVGVFGGSWPAFVDYLGETPHPDDAADHEPPPRLALITDELAPAIQARVATARSYWDIVGEVERRQRSTERLARALVPDSEDYLYADGRSGRLILEDGWKRCLPPDLNSAVMELWGTQYWPQTPQRIVTAPNPHFNLALAIGPAIRFWHGAHLTAWYMCRGGWSRTTLADLRRYYERDLLELSRLECPVEPSLLKRIADAERLLGPAREVVGKHELIQSGSVRISIGTDISSERDGFEAARDVIATAREEWTRLYLTTYLQRRAHEDLESANRFYWRAVADRTKPPTIKQFTGSAGSLADNWLGGDLEAAYVIIGATSPIHAELVGRRSLPRLEFVQKLLEGLGGRNLNLDPVSAGYREAWEVVSMANAGLRYLQAREGTGGKPQFKDVHRIVERYVAIRGADAQQMLDWYDGVVSWALAALIGV